MIGKVVSVCPSATSDRISFQFGVCGSTLEVVQPI